MFLFAFYFCESLHLTIMALSVLQFSCCTGLWCSRPCGRGRPCIFLTFNCSVLPVDTRPLYGLFNRFRRRQLGQTLWLKMLETWRGRVVLAVTARASIAATFVLIRHVFSENLVEGFPVISPETYQEAPKFWKLRAQRPFLPGVCVFFFLLASTMYCTSSIPT